MRMPCEDRFWAPSFGSTMRPYNHKNPVLPTNGSQKIPKTTAARLEKKREPNFRKRGSLAIPLGFVSLVGNR